MIDKTVNIFDLVGPNSSYFTNINKDIKDFGKKLQNIFYMPNEEKNKVGPLQKTGNSKIPKMSNKNDRAGR